MCSVLCILVNHRFIWFVTHLTTPCSWFFRLYCTIVFLFVFKFFWVVQSFKSIVIDIIFHMCILLVTRQNHGSFPIFCWNPNYSRILPLFMLEKWFVFHFLLNHFVDIFCWNILLNQLYQFNIRVTKLINLSS